MHMILRLVVALVMVTGITACGNLVQVKIDVVDQRTALQNQVLGSYQRLEGDLPLYASVRSIDSEGRLVEPPPMPKGKRAAIRAMRRSLFNQDDIDALKTKGAMGEGRDGYLTLFANNKALTDRKAAAFAQNLVEQENEDRHIIYQRVVSENENFSDGDLPTVEAIMAGLNRDSARKGEMIETDSGRWVRKGSE